MDPLTILYIIASFIVGAIISFFLKKDKKGETVEINNQLSALSTQNEALQSKLSEATNKIKSLEIGSSNKIEEIKRQYEELLKEANSQCDRLDQKLKKVLEGNIDDSIKKELIESEKLKKKIKDLEEELEDTEDDLSNAKKKLKNKDDEFAKLQEDYYKEAKISKELKTELLSVKQALEEKTYELSLKIGSIDFVQEILSAPKAKNSDLKRIESLIAEVKSFALGQVMDCYASIKDVYVSFNNGNFDEYKKYWNKRFDEWASVTRKNWISGKITIAFVGEFSAGKTSIVNRILSQDDPTVPQLPVSTKATTAVATYIAGGPETNYQFVTPDDILKDISKQTFTEKVSKEILDQIKGVSSLIKYFVMTYKNPNLDGMSILDTPGFNSNDSEDAIRTIEVINECDALFWVFDVNTGNINRSSIKIIKENLNKPLYVVINKVDLKTASDVQKVEDLIKKTLSDEGLKVEAFIRFSEKAPLSDIMNPIKSVQHIAEKEQYILDLGDGIEGILKILNSKFKEANNKYHSAESMGQRVDEKFIQQMKTLYNHCNIAAGIPHFEEHIFRKDNYELSQEEYSRLCNVLEETCSDVQTMANIYDEKTNSAYTIQNSWTDVCNIKAAWQSVSELQKKYKKIRNRF